jgi:hypothetical protein
MVMDEFAGRLRGQLDANGIAEGWVRVVAGTMQPTSVGVWLRSEDLVRTTDTATRGLVTFSGR